MVTVNVRSSAGWVQWHRPVNIGTLSRRGVQCTVSSLRNMSETLPEVHKPGRMASVFITLPVRPETRVR